MPQLDFITYKHIGCVISITIIAVCIIVSMELLPGVGFLIKKIEQIIYENVLSLKTNDMNITRKDIINARELINKERVNKIK